MKQYLFLSCMLSTPILYSMEIVSIESSHQPLAHQLSHNRVDNLALQQEDLIELTPINHLPKAEWERELLSAIKDCRSSRLIELLSEDGTPQATRSGLPNFTPNLTALEQIKIEKQKRVLILTNKAEADAKHCKCCNPSFVWNRAIAPGAIFLFAFGQLGFSIWAVEQAASISLVQNPGNNLQAFMTAGPSIGSLLAAVGGLFFSIKNAHDLFKLKEVEKAYNYYVIAEHNITTQDNIEALLKEQGITLKQLLANQAQYIPA